MKIPKYLVYLICASAFFGAIGHWFIPTQIEQKSEFQILESIPEKEQINEFIMAINSKNSETLKAILGKLCAKNIDPFLQAYENGQVSQIWGFDRYENVSRIALEIKMNYKQRLSLNKTGNALFVFRLEDSKWQIEWFTPGAVFWTQNEKE